MTFHEKAQANIARAGYRDMERDFMALAEACKPFTMTTVERMYALWGACGHVLDRGVPGAFVECGTWRGGSAMLMALTLRSRGILDRRIVLYDTFAGQPAPGPKDVDIWGQDQKASHEAFMVDGQYRGAQASMREVMANMISTGYPGELIHLVAGKVEDTLPELAPDRIALLRLDTDWYESTKHCLSCLWPALSPGGVLILDDYGHLEGARAATDEYFHGKPDRPLLHRVDYSGRVGVKPS